MKIVNTHFQSKISHFASRRSNGKISSFAIFAASVAFILMTIPSVFAQTLIDSASINVTAEITNGCEWSAGAGSALTVRDNNICRITGTESATSVTIEGDVDTLGQSGGKLIVGYDSGASDTTFTISSNLNVGVTAEGGILNVGGEGTNTGTSTVTFSGTSTTNGLYALAGSVSTVDANGIIVKSSTYPSLYVYDNSGETNPASFTNNGAITLYNIIIGADNNPTYPGGTLTNNGTITSTDTGYGASNVYRGIFNNEAGGTFTISNNGGLYVRGTSGSVGQFNNSGTVTSANADFIWAFGELNLNGTSTYTNTNSAGVAALNDTTSATGGSITIQENATLSATMVTAGHNWTGADYDGDATITNYGIISYNGSRSTSATLPTSVYARDGSTVTNKSTGYIDLYTGSVYSGYQSADPTNDYFLNESGGEITSTSTSSRAYLYHGADFTNQGEMSVGAVYVSDGVNPGNALFLNEGILTTSTTSYVGYNSGGGGGTLENDGTYTANGYLYSYNSGLIQNDSTLNVNNQLYIQAAGRFDNNDTVNKGATGTIILGDGEYRSSGTSTLNLNNTNGFQLNHASAKAELDGTIIGTQSKIDGDNGYLCVGNYDWTLLTCSNNPTGSLSIYHTSSSAFDITPFSTASFDLDIENDVTIDGSMRLGYSNSTNTATLTADQGASSTITVLMDNASFAYLMISSLNTTATFNGTVNVKNATANSNHGYLQVYYGADANLEGSGEIGSIYMYSNTNAANDTTLTIGDSANFTLIDWETCQSGLTGNCALEIGPHDYNDNTILNIEGTLDIDNTGYRTGTPISRIGYTTNSNNGNEIVNVKSAAGWGGSLTNSTTGTFYTQLSGEINTEYTDATHYGSVEVQGAATMNGTGDIDGSFDAHDLIWLQSNADMSVGMDGIMDANGSQTTVDGLLTLDGQLNRTTARATAGDVVVQSGGNITSGIGTTTNFIINANDLDVQSGGSISSDEASDYGSTASVAGSYGGEGKGRSSGSTYGKTKMNINDTPLYGELGGLWCDPSNRGGGGVRINANGNIDIDGTISANGADATNCGAGAGGTVILVHDIDHTDTSATFTGSGTISANGGGSATTGVNVGGGGKIVIDSILYDDPMDDTPAGEYGFTGTIQALGGTNSVDSDYAAAGTIVLLGDDNNPNGTLIVNQGGNATAGEDTEIYDTGTDADFTFDRVEVLGSGSITYVSAPATSPIGCFRTSGTITGPTT
ncbi:hypothetical protein KKD70_01465, partial [Patescibacteria group bacterium]|nr:hypothetical protein [Patescibacteria group bacterium]